MGRYALLDRIAVLEAQLAETTQQRDFAREVLAYASGKREQDWAEGVIGTAETLVGAILYQHNSSLEAQLAEARALIACLADKPEDRLYHAQDGTWWRREGKKLLRADSPPVVAEAQERANTLTERLNVAQETIAALRSELAAAEERLAAKENL